MSYLITAWETVSIDNLEIPIDAIRNEPAQGWQPEIDVDDDMDVVVTFIGNESCLEGSLRPDGMIAVHCIRFVGECSSGAKEYALKPILDKSRGKLIVNYIWDGCQIYQMSVTDGNLVDTHIPLEKVNLPR